MGMLRRIALISFFLLPLTATAAQFRDFGPYRVHYNAFPSTFIAPEVAQAYGLNRSRYRGLLNITVQTEGSGAQWPATAAVVRATATNPYGQVREIDMQEIREGQAVYYIGEFPVTDKEELEFQVQVRPSGTERSYGLDFSQRFFIQ